MDLTDEAYQSFLNDLLMGNIESTGFQDFELEQDQESGGHQEREQIKRSKKTTPPDTIIQDLKNQLLSIIYDDPDERILSFKESFKGVQYTSIGIAKAAKIREVLRTALLKLSLENIKILFNNLKKEELIFLVKMIDSKKRKSHLDLQNKNKVRDLLLDQMNFI